MPFNADVLSARDHALSGVMMGTDNYFEFL